MRFFKCVGVLIATASPVWLWSAGALACTCSTMPIYASVPAHEAQDVAINQAVVVDGVFSEDSIVFESADGTAIEFDLISGPAPTCPGTSALLVPRGPLSPKTRYTVRVTPLFPEGLEEKDSRLSFTTGTRTLPDDEPKPPPAAIASVISGTPDDGASCGGGGFYTCADVEDFENVEVLATRGGAILMRWRALDRENSFAFDVSPDCIEFRRVSATGRRSAPLSLCGEHILRRPFRSSDMGEHWIECHMGRVGTDANAPGPVAGAGGMNTPQVSEADAGQAESASDAGATTTPAQASAGAPPSKRLSADTGCAVARPGQGGSDLTVWTGLALAFAVFRAVAPRKRRQRVPSRTS